MQRLHRPAYEAADQTPVEPKRHHVRRPVCGLARPHVAEARQHRRPYQVVVAEHRGMGRHYRRNPPELPPIQQLTVRQVDIRHRERAHIDDLAHTLEHGARLQIDDLRLRQLDRAPICEAHGCARVAARAHMTHPTAPADRRCAVLPLA